MKRSQLARLLSLAVLGGMLIQTGVATPVTFWFTGYTTTVRNPSNTMPIAVSVGMPFAGRLTYDPAMVWGDYTNSTPGGAYSGHYFTNIAGYSMQLQLAGHLITNTEVPDFSSGLAAIYNNYNDEDSITLESGKYGLRVDGQSYVSAPDFSLMSIYLSDRSQTALSNAGLPAAAPALSDFPDLRSFYWGAYIDDGGPTELFMVEGEITVISTNELVLLDQRMESPGRLRLSWPKPITGFTLESSTNLTSGGWQAVTNAVTDIGPEHTVTVPIARPHRFFRLRK